METDKPTREFYADVKEYKRAYDRWRDKNLPNRKARVRPEGYQREQYLKHREARLAEKKVYFQENKAKINEYQRGYVKERYHADPEFRAKSIQRSQANSIANPEGRKAAKRRESERYHADPDLREKVRQRNIVYVENNIEKINKKRAEFREQNRAMLAERQRARLVSATPPWITPEQRQEMVLVYQRAAEVSVLTGVPHEVDHIWPLRGRNSCGLHVPWNLQVISQTNNRRKMNREPVGD